MSEHQVPRRLVPESLEDQVIWSATMSSLLFRVAAFFGIRSFFASRIGDLRISRIEIEKRRKQHCGRHLACAIGIKTDCAMTGAGFCFPIYWTPSRPRRYWWFILWWLMWNLGFEPYPFSSLDPVKFGPWKILALRWRDRRKAKFGRMVSVKGMLYYRVDHQLQHKHEDSDDRFRSVPLGRAWKPEMGKEEDKL